MTTSSVPNNLPPTDISANTTEAHRLFQRGVAAARGGQRRVAAGLLTRSVQLNPHNEQAWLWLSGVVDDPHQTAFCLNTVLKLNPHNERATKGLQWLEQQNKLSGTPQPSALNDIQLDMPAAPTARGRASGNDAAWWVRWRSMRRDMSYIRVVLLSLPLVLLLIALALHQTFAQAVARSQEPPPMITPTAVTVAQAPILVLAPLVAPTPTLAPVLETDTAPVSASRSVQYLASVEPIRRELRAAVEQFRTSIGRPGGSVEHVAATQEFYVAVEQAEQQMAALTPPPELEQAHEIYLQGLAIELVAIRTMQDFYGSYEVELANRAASRFQEANALFATARAQFDMRLQALQSDSSVSVHTLR